MPYREFVDAAGATWRVWDVFPQFLDRRASSDRRTNARPIGERRAESGALHVSPGLSEGWLCFEHATEKRRLAPIPSGWLSVSDAELETMCNAARTVARSRTADSAR